ncbi:MAG TPA: hypothetical protein VHK64_08505 [Nocardioidaceae bacterium]|nr:hypothetical protein [Nocardioidaceae bacterium]
MSPEKLIRYTRDAGCVLLGLGGIAFQIYTGNMSAIGMGTCMGLLGLTGAANALQLLPTGNPQRGGRGPSSSSPRSGSRPPSSPRSGGDR